MHDSQTFSSLFVERSPATLAGSLQDPLTNYDQPIGSSAEMLADPIREALAQLLRNIDIPADKSSDGQVILDTEVDEARYILVRHALKPARESSDLSPREQEIARMVAAGYPNKIIAGVLDISAWTVCTYMRRIFAKLNVTSRAAMVTRLHRDGLLK